MGDYIHVLVWQFLDRLIDGPHSHWLWLRGRITIGATLLVLTLITRISIGILRRRVIPWRRCAIRILRRWRAIGILQRRVRIRRIWLRGAIRILWTAIPGIWVLSLTLTLSAIWLWSLCWIPTHKSSPLLKLRNKCVL